MEQSDRFKKNTFTYNLKRIQVLTIVNCFIVL